MEKIEAQIFQALDEAKIILLVVDARLGITAHDQEIANFLRKRNLSFLVLANKSDVPGREFLEHEFYALGGEGVVSISAEHRLGFDAFWEAVLPFVDKDLVPEKPKNENCIRVCIVGRPNVGKSSLLNRLVGKERAVASSRPGTTTDPVDEEIIVDGQAFLIIDTAGIRRPSKRENDVEDLGVFYAKRNLAQADIALLLVDAEEGITSQDGTIAELVEEAGTAAILIANKWDKAPQEIRRANDAVETFADKAYKLLPLLDFAPLLGMSVLNDRIYGGMPGKDAEDARKLEIPRDLSEIWSLIRELVAAREQTIPAKEIQEYIDQRVFNVEHLVRETGPLKKIHQVGNRPPQFLAYVKDANKASESLRRFLSRAVRERFGFRGNPIRWIFKHRTRL
jgi:GTP-binding protein